MKKDVKNDECADPDDEFEGVLLVDDGTTDKMIFLYQSHSVRRL